MHVKKSQGSNIYRKGVLADSCDKSNPLIESLIQGTVINVLNQ